MRSSIPCVLCATVLGIAADSFAQESAKTARVTVVAVDSFGHRLTNPDVYSFVDEKNNDERVALFRHNTADGVPYGRYRISVQANGGYRESTFDVDVASPEVLITAGLEWIGVENTEIRGRFRGRIFGYAQTAGDGSCRASGLYLRNQYESAIHASDMSFDFGEVPAGAYTLACTANGKILALRVIQVRADTKPLTLNYTRGEQLSAPE